MKKEVDININVLDNRKNNENGVPPVVLGEGKKIKSNLSVSQLAFLYRLLYDVEAISLTNQTDILKFISENFQITNAPRYL